MLVYNAHELTIYGQRFFAIAPNDPQLEEVKLDCELQNARVLYMLEDAFSKQYRLPDCDRNNSGNMIAWKNFRLFDEKWSFGEWYNDYNPNICIARETESLQDILDAAQCVQWFGCGSGGIVLCDPICAAYLRAVKI